MGDFTREEAEQVAALSNKLYRHQWGNVEKWQFYDEKQAIKNLGIAIPESMLNVEAVVGWAAIVVDAMRERMKWQGFVPTGAEGIGSMQSLVEQNGMANEVGSVVLDGLVSGTGFLSVTQGDVSAGEPKALVRAISSLNATYDWDPRLKRARRGLVLSVGADGEKITTLYTLNETIEQVVWSDGTRDLRRFEHGRGRCSLVPVLSYMQVGATMGKSELSRGMRYLIEHAVRTMLGMEYNREIYTTPQRYFTNTEPEQLGFEQTDSPWEVAEKGYRVSMNRTVVVPPNEEGDRAEPKVGQFSAAPPTPYIDQIEMLARQIAARSGLSPTRFGYTTSNPPSADAIRADSNSHVSKAQDRIDFVDAGIREAARVMLHIENGEAPSAELMGSFVSDWRDPATPTPAAAVDQAQKLVASGIVPADSEVLLRKCYFSPDEIKQIQLERQRSVSRQLLERVRERQGEDVADPVVDDLVSRVDAPA